VAIPAPYAGAVEGWRSALAVFRGEYRRAAAVLLAAIAAITVVAWAVTIGVGMTPSMMAMMVATGGWAGFAIFLGIWLAMMVAMMFPASAPMAEAYVHLSSAEGTKNPWRTASAATFLGVYAAVWTSIGVAVAVAYLLLVPRIPELTMSGSLGATLAGATLVVAGIYQATPLKDACLRGCQTPFSFLSTGWRPGLRGALRLGARHALYCVGCCALLFAVLFAVGLMAIGWMLLIALLIFAEKLIAGPAGRKVAWAVGGVLVVLGGLVIASPAFAGWALGLAPM
jgi:predicted metal-binding membrane protein